MVFELKTNVDRMVVVVVVVRSVTSANQNPLAIYQINWPRLEGKHGKGEAPEFYINEATRSIDPRPACPPTNHYHFAPNLYSLSQQYENWPKTGVQTAESSAQVLT